MPTFETPGVFIEEQTGPGVIAGVGTSTAGFIGPAKRGPLKKPRRVSSFDEFLSVYAAPDGNGNLDPFIKEPQTFFLAHAVRGFFENGGSQAFIVRIGDGVATAWEVKNDLATPATLFTVEALDPGPNSGIKILVSKSHLTRHDGVDGVEVARGSSPVEAVDLPRKTVTVRNAADFRVDDSVTTDALPQAVIKKIAGNVLTLNLESTGFENKTLRIADLAVGQTRFRMASTAGLFQGSLVEIKVGNQSELALIDKVETTGFVTLRVGLTRTFSLATEAPTVTSQEFDLTIQAPEGFESESFKNLSLERAHTRFAGNTVRSKLVKLMNFVATVPSTERRPKIGEVPISRTGSEVNLNSITVDNYLKGLEELDKVDDVNLICIPDAAARGQLDAEILQKAMIDSCRALKDRFAILDSLPGLEPAGVEAQRAKLDSGNGFAALYYPWLEARDPTSAASPPLTMLIPPCGHIAGVFARTDQERGVHKAPANTDVRGILGLERVLSNGQQGPLNIKGINVLRIFPGSSTVVVWGARTTVNPAISDWLYVNVRRLLLFIEESIEEGIRPAVFEPNAPPLWKALTRTISQFLTQVWRAGGLFGDTPDQAFRVRIDEALNPPSERARGRLFIEIRVAPVRPAEFIVVRIGLFDGGADVQEG